MNFIGKQLAEGAYSGFLGKIDEFIAYLSNQPLPEEARENYQRITQSALGCLSVMIKKTKHELTSKRFSKNVEKMTFRTLAGVSSATKKFFLEKKGPRNRFGKTQTHMQPMSSFFKKAESIFKEIGHVASKEAKKQLLSFFSNWIIDGIQIAIDGFQSEDSNYVKLKKHLDIAKESIHEACRDGDIQKILQSLKTLSSELSESPIYFNGIPLLRTSQAEDSAIIKGISNTKTLKDLIEKHDQEGQDQIVNIHKQLDVLAKNLAIQNTFRFIFLFLLDQPLPDHQTIFENPRLHLAKKRLYDEIQASKASSYLKQCAFLTSSLLLHVFYHVLGFALTQLEHKIHKFVRQPRPESINYTKIASFFSKLNAAHLNIVETTHTSGTLDELVTQNMESLQEQTSLKLYERVQRKFLQEFSFKLPIVNIFWKKVWKINFHHLALNVIFYPFKVFLSLCGSLALFIPELIINFILAQSLRLSFFWQNTLPNMILKSLVSFSDYTRSIHPINQMMVEHLQKIWNHLKSSYLETDENPSRKEILNPASKASLDLALKHLFELLEKTPFETPEELIHFLKSQSPLDKTKTSATRFFMSQNLAAFAQIIGQAVNALFDPEAKHKLVGSALLSINQGFSKKMTLTQKSMSETETKINILLSQILSLTIRKTIERRYNFTPKNQSEITDRFLRSIQYETKQFYEIFEPQLSAHQFELPLTPLVQTLNAYCGLIQNKQLEIRSHAELPKNPRALVNEWFCEPIQEKIDEMIQLFKKIKFFEQLNEDSDFLKKHLLELKKPQSLTADNIKSYLDSSYLIHHCSNKLSPLIPQLKIIYEYFEAFQEMKSLKEKLEHIKHEKELAVCKIKIEELLESIEDTNPLYSSFLILKPLLKTLSFSQLRLKIEDLLGELITHLDLKAIAVSQKALDILEVTPNSELQNLISKTASIETYEATKKKLAKELEALKHLVEKFQPIEHFNIKFISTNDALELMQNFAFGCMIGPMEQLLKLIKKPYIWQYGIVNQLCLKFLE